MPATEGTAAAWAALNALASGWGMRLSDEESSRLMAFAQLLTQWNQRINLTGAATVETLIAEQFPDSFALATVLTEAARVVDVGSGGGLPAIPLAVLRPALRVQLVEPLAKKVAFLRTAVRELGLGDSVAVEARRVKDLIASAEGSFDVAVSRATFPPAEWLELGQKLVRPGGRVLLLTVPKTQAPGRRLTYEGGRRVLIQVDRQERST